jgi:hypothetical protein
VFACVKKKFEVGFRGGFCEHTNPLKSTVHFCRFLFAAEKERKKTDEKTPKASLLRFRTVMASRFAQQHPTVT